MRPDEFKDAKLLWKMFYAEPGLKPALVAAEHVFKEGNFVSGSAERRINALPTLVGKFRFQP